MNIFLDIISYIKDNAWYFKKKLTILSAKLQFSAEWLYTISKGHS